MAELRAGGLALIIDSIAPEDIGKCVFKRSFPIRPEHGGTIADLDSPAGSFGQQGIQSAGVSRLCFFTHRRRFTDDLATYGQWNDCVDLDHGGQHPDSTLDLRQNGQEMALGEKQCSVF